MDPVVKAAWLAALRSGDKQTKETHDEWQDVSATKLYGFWSSSPSSHYPYVLAAPITHLRADGDIKVQGYLGFIFKPLKILPEAAGKALHEKLKALEAEERRSRKELHERFCERVVQTIGSEARIWPYLIASARGEPVCIHTDTSPRDD